MAGGGAISYPRFLLFDLIGGVAWAGLFVALGYALGAPARALIERHGWGVLIAFAVLTVAGPAAIILVRLARRRRHGPAGAATG